MSHHNHGGGSKTPKGYPENLLKNFKPDAVLEPIKVDNLLVDLTDESSKPDELSYHTQLFKEQNPYTLVDLFENLFVTPEFLQKQNKRKEDSKGDSDWSFLNYETGNQENNSQINSEAATKTIEKGNKQLQMELESTFDKMVRQNSILKPRNICDNNIEVTNAQDHEDLIDELLQSKSMAKHNMQDEARTSNIKVLPLPKIDNIDRLPKSTFEEDVNQIIDRNCTCTAKTKTMNELNSVNVTDIFSKIETNEETINRGIYTNPPTPSTSKLNDNLVSQFLETMGCDNFKLKTPAHRSNSCTSNLSSDSGFASILSRSTSSNINVCLDSAFASIPLSILNDLADMSSRSLEKEKPSKSDSTLEKTSTSDILSRINGAANLEIMSVMPIQAAVKEQKEIAKHKVTIDEKERMVYTTGPDLEEKKVVLPQLLSRLALINKVVKTNELGKKKFILDEGRKKGIAKSLDDIPVLSPSVLMEDCNKERMKALKTRQGLEKIVTCGNILN